MAWVVEVIADTVLQDLHSYFFPYIVSLIAITRSFHCTPSSDIPAIIPPNAFHYFVEISSMIHKPQHHNSSNTIPCMGDKMHTN